MALYLTPNDIRIGRCSLPHDWFIGFQVVWGLISVVARVGSGAVAKSTIVGVPSFRREWVKCVTRTRTRVRVAR